jgi:acetyl-CoA carboxylase carboxyltransferase component
LNGKTPRGLPESWSDLVDDLAERKSTARLMGGADRVERQHRDGRLTARDRVGLLVDEGSFLEFGLLNHSDQPGAEAKSPADGMIAGFAMIDGRPALVRAYDKTVFAGAEGFVGLVKKDRSLRMYAQRHRLPVFSLAEGGGLRIPDGMGSDGILTRNSPSEHFATNRTTPRLTAILGDSYGGPGWDAAMADFATQVEGTCMAVSGPRMIEVATGERIDPQELGGAHVHAEVTGQVDLVAKTEPEAIGHLKRFFSFMPLNSSEEPPFGDSADDPYRLLESATSIVPFERTKVYDMRKLVAALVDDGDFFALKPEFGTALITALARLGGRVVGIVASQPRVRGGALSIQECEKATEFVCLCDSYNIPLIFLQDVPGYLVGSKPEREKILTKIYVWKQALALSTVPKLTVIVRKAIGAAQAQMGGPGTADFVVAWPSAEVSFTGPEVGVNVVYGKQIGNAADPGAERRRLLSEWAFDASPYRAAGVHAIDDVIDPRETRRFLVRALEFACASSGSIGQHRLANWPFGF